LKNSSDTIRNRTRDLPAVAQSLNQLRHFEAYWTLRYHSTAKEHRYVWRPQQCAVNHIKHGNLLLSLFLFIKLIFKESLQSDMQDELLALLSDRRNASAWNNLILKKLMAIQLATAIRTFYGTRRSNVIFKKACQVFSKFDLLLISSSMLLWCANDVPKHWDFAVFMKDESYT